MRNPNARREQFRRKKVFSPSITLALAILAAIPIIVYSYNDSWLCYYNVSKEDNALVLEYFFPNQLVRVGITDELKITTSSFQSRYGRKYRILISEGDSYYRSQTVSRSQAEESVARLKQAVSG